MSTVSQALRGLPTAPAAHWQQRCGLPPCLMQKQHDRQSLSSLGQPHMFGICLPMAEQCLPPLPQAGAASESVGITNAAVSIASVRMAHI
jgi:hypothetical protein